MDLATSQKYPLHRNDKFLSESIRPYLKFSYKFFLTLLLLAAPTAEAITCGELLAEAFERLHITKTHVNESARHTHQCKNLGTCWIHATAGVIETQSFSKGINFQLSHEYIFYRHVTSQFLSHLDLQNIREFTGESKAFQHEGNPLAFFTIVNRYGAIPESQWAGRSLDLISHDLNALATLAKRLLKELRAELANNAQRFGVSDFENSQDFPQAFVNFHTQVHKKYKSRFLRQINRVFATENGLLKNDSFFPLEFRRTYLPEKLRFVSRSNINMEALIKLVQEGNPIYASFEWIREAVSDTTGDITNYVPRPRRLPRYHAVQIVGVKLGVTGEVKYWIIRNSHREDTGTKSSLVKMHPQYLKKTLRDIHY